MFRALEGRPVSQGPFLGEGRSVCRTDENRPHDNERSGWACSSDPPLLPPSSCLFHGGLSSLFRNIYLCLLPWQALKHRDEQGPQGPALFGLGNPGGHFLNCSAAAARSRGLGRAGPPGSEQLWHKLFLSIEFCFATGLLGCFQALCPSLRLAGTLEGF